MTTKTNLSCQSHVDMPCLRCGVCCEEPFVSLNLAEARHITDGMGLDWEAWLERYIDGGWPEADTLFLGKVDGVCIFLERGTDARVTLCTAHAYKPSACRDWAPDLHGRYCQEGLTRQLGPGGQTPHPPVDRLVDRE